MGIVYEALDGVLNRRVAIKLVDAGRRDLPEMDDRFLREAQLAARLEKHPHIVTIYEADIIGGRRYLCMEYIDGMPMGDWFKGTHVPVREQVLMLRDVALAAHHAHESGVIHRDLKPSNVLVDVKGHPHVTDFGLAKPMDSNAAGSATGSGFTVGTPAYMSPEQAKGSKSVDARSDIYSLGVMLFEILTGKLPFTGETAIEIMLNALRNPAPAPSSVATQLTPVERNSIIDRICLKAMAKEPADRYPTARAFAEDLGRWAEDKAVVISPPPPAPRRSSAVWFPAAAMVAAAVVIAAIVQFQRPPAPASVKLTGRAELTGHEGAINGVAFSPDGRFLAAGSADSTISLWDVSKGERIAELKGHEGKVEGVAFSPDGKTLATVGELTNAPGEVFLWDVPSRRKRLSLAGHTGPVNAAAFSRDGSRLATGSQDKTIRLWNPATGEGIGTLRGHAHAIRGVAFIAGDKLLVSGGWDNIAKLWDLEKQTPIAEFAGHTAGIWGLGVSADERLLATAGSQGEVRLIDLVNRKDLTALRGHGSVSQCAAFRPPDGRVLATGGRDRALRLWDTKTFTEVGAVTSLAETAWCAAFSPDGKLLAAGLFDGTIRLWNVEVRD